MKLSNVKDEDLQKVALLKTRRGCATADAKRAQQILRTRNVTHGGFGAAGHFKHFEAYGSNLDHNITREYKTFKEENGCTLEEWTEKERRRNRERYMSK